MRIFLDTNILLDVLLDRKPHVSAAQTLLTLAEQKKHATAISAISVNNIYYIVKKLGNRKKADIAVDTILELFEIIAVDKLILNQARHVQTRDYEDAIQYCSARAHRAQVLISRNEEDYPQGDLRVLSGESFLNGLSS